MFFEGLSSVVGESIDERESRKLKKGLLSVYRTFCKAVEFKTYLHGACDAGTRLMFKFTSGTHEVNEELGRYRGGEGRKECLFVIMNVRASCVVGLSSLRYSKK